MNQQSQDINSVGSTSTDNSIGTSELKYVCMGDRCLLVPSENDSKQREIKVQSVREKTELKTVSGLYLGINPTKVPLKFKRYYHPSHCHKLFMLTGLRGHRCDNLNCSKHIQTNETIFSCFRCDFDLCDICFQLGSNTPNVSLASDDKDIDETTVRPLNEYFSVLVGNGRNEPVHDHRHPRFHSENESKHGTDTQEVCESEEDDDSHDSDDETDEDDDSDETDEEEFEEADAKEEKCCKHN